MKPRKTLTAATKSRAKQYEELKKEVAAPEKGISGYRRPGSRVSKCRGRGHQKLL
ncbi:hypothetical protein [Peribacillus butanolivorans]